MDIRSIDELRKFAAKFAGGIEPRNDHATLITLSGDLGAGKTTFTQAVAEALGVEENVTSPTFVIEKLYQLKGQKFERLIHIDAYRLESSHELETLGFREILKDPTNLILIEWPERVAGLIPEDATKIRFDIRGDQRIITLDGEEKG